MMYAEQISSQNEMPIHFQENEDALTLKGKNFCLGSKAQNKNKQIKVIGRVPWLDSNGKMRPDHEIEKLGQNWSAATWDEYLKATVDMEKEDDDSTVSFPYMDTDTIANGDNLLQYLRNIDEYEGLQDYLEFALKKLTSRERQILRMKYWDELTQIQICQILGIAECTVSTTRRKALKKLKKLLCSQEFKEEIKTLKLLENIETYTP